MVANEKWFGASAGFYPETIDQSLRFEDGDSPYLLRTPSSTGNRKTWTVSCWLKIGNTGLTSNIISVFQSASPNQQVVIRFYQDKLYLYDFAGAYLISTNRVFRDTTNWYHMVWRFDSTQSTASERIKLYINGTQETDLNDNSYPSLNHDSLWNHTNKHLIGARTDNSTPTPIQEFDGYLAEFNLVDGQALGPESFGELKNGTWIPKSLSSISYGTNGFRLTFADSSSLGDDTSGNGNDFTSSGLASTDVVTDSPTNNFCTLNRLNEFASRGYMSLSEGNLKSTASGSPNQNRGWKSTFAMSSGKWYWEVYFNSSSSDNNGGIGVSGSTNNNITPGEGNDSGFRYMDFGDLVFNGSNQGTIQSISATDIVMVAVDIDNSKAWVGKNGSWFSSGNPSSGSNALTTSVPSEAFATSYHYSTGAVMTFNFGADSTFAGVVSAGTNSDANNIGSFKYSVPTNFLALCASNLPDSTISPNSSNGTADEFFNTVLYTGNGASRSITDVGFRPDWSWFKSRSNSSDHYLFDSSRGASNNSLSSNDTGVEDTTSGQFTQFTDTGFDLPADSAGYINYNSRTYVAWNWKAGGTTPTKTYKVKVVADSTDYGHGTGSNKYQFFKSDGTTGFGTNGVDIVLQEGGTYVFDYSDSSAQGHPLRFSLTNDGTHSSGTSAGSEYTTGVVKDDSAYKITITIASGVASLYYYCANHSGMGAEISTNETHGSTNFDGSITSVVQTNETAQFSIITGTTVNVQANDMSETFGHGLSGTPDFLIIKPRNANFLWSVWTSAITISDVQGLTLNSQGALFTNSSYRTIQATSSVVKIGRQAVENNSTNFVCYAFKEVKGFSRFGSFTGNGSTDGTFVFTGFRPAWILIKSSSNGEPWNLVDIKRDTFNVMGDYLQPNTQGAEGTLAFVDGLSNGFKLRSSGSGFNGNGYTFIYIAFAEQPFKFSNGR